MHMVLASSLKLYVNASRKDSDGKVNTNFSALIYLLKRVSQASILKPTLFNN